MSRGIETEWSPALGASWHVVHVPLMLGRFSRSFNPATSVIAIGRLLKIASPRATDNRAWLLGSVPESDAQFPYKENAAELKAAFVGFNPIGSLIPRKKSWFESASGPPPAPSAPSHPARESKTCAT